MKFKNLKEAIRGYALASRYLGEAVAYREAARWMIRNSTEQRYAMRRMRQAAQWAVSDGKYAYKFQKSL